MKKTFVIQMPEYFSYLRYITSQTGANQTRQLWLKFSVPLLCIAAVIVFSAFRTLNWFIAMAVLSVLWTSVVSPFLYKRTLNAGVSRMIAKLNIKDTPPVNIELKENLLKVNNDNIPLNQITRTAVLDDILILFCDKPGLVVIPRRVFENQEETEFLNKVRKN
jgi:hypothetical protein